MIAKGMGIDALKVKNYSELPSAFDTALKATQAENHSCLILKLMIIVLCQLKI